MSTKKNPARRWTELYYRLPVECLVEGVSTADGQDVLKVRRAKGYRGSPEMVLFEVYTPRSDDPKADDYNRRTSETRFADVGEPVELCVFSDTVTDLTRHPKATQLQWWNPDTRVMTGTSRKDWRRRQRANGY